MSVPDAGPTCILSVCGAWNIKVSH
jgi:hypothetical protein